MADLKKFEEMLERLVNEDKAGAEELFHEIVVEKSREIYENLLEDDLDDEAVDEATDEEVDESDEEVDEASDEEVDESDDEEVKEDFDLDEFEVEADPMADMGGDPADDMMGDVEADPEMDMGDEEGGEDGDMEDRIEDLEDALDDLKAEFDAMMAGDDAGDDEGEDAGDDMDAGDEEPEEAMAFEADDEEVEEAADEEVDEAADEEVEETSKAPKSNAEQMREYVEKVVGGHGAETKGKGEDGGVNKKSTVAGKNDMGGTASNLNQGDTGDVVEAGKGALKGNGLADTTAKEDNAGNVNVPGAKAGKAQSAVSAGHGAEKKGSGETADNKKSTIGS